MWVCDTCGKVIEKESDGVIEWFDDFNMIYIVHKKDSCKTDKPLESIIGPSWADISRDSYKVLTLLEWLRTDNIHGSPLYNFLKRLFVDDYDLFTNNPEYSPLNTPERDFYDDFIEDRKNDH